MSRRRRQVLPAVRVRTSSRAVVVAVIAVLVGPATVACGETIDLRDQEPTAAAPEPEVAVAAEATEVTDAAIPVDGSLDELLPLLLQSWRGLDQRVIDEEATAPLARIEEIWALAEPQLRADHPGSLFGYQQAIDLARSAVERHRPADASKGYRLAIELTDHLVSR